MQVVVVQSGPFAAQGQFPASQPLTILPLGAALFESSDLSTSPIKPQQVQLPQGVAYFSKLKDRHYFAGLFYWDVPPSHNFPVTEGVIGPILTEGPRVPVTVPSGDEITTIELEYNPTGTGPYSQLTGIVRFTGNPIYSGAPIQLVFMPQQRAAGQAPAEKFVVQVWFGSTSQGLREVELDLQQGEYALGIVGDRLRLRDVDGSGTQPLDLRSSVTGLEIHINNTSGARPAGLGQISGVLNLDNWDLDDEPLVISAERQDYITNNPPGMIGNWFISYEGLHDTALWQITERDVNGAEASFTLGWLNDGNYTITIRQGKRSRLIMPQVVLSPGNRDVTGLQIE